MRLKSGLRKKSAGWAMRRLPDGRKVEFMKDACGNESKNIRTFPVGIT
jgi:hypothetical protein